MGDVSWKYYEGTLKDGGDWRTVGHILEGESEVLGWHCIRSSGPKIRYCCYPEDEVDIGAKLEEYTVDGFALWDHSPLGQLYESIPAVTILEILEANSRAALKVPHLEDKARLHFLVNWHHYLARQFQGGITNQQEAIVQADGLIRNLDNMLQHFPPSAHFVLEYVPHMIEALNGKLDRANEIIEAEGKALHNGAVDENNGQ